MDHICPSKTCEETHREQGIFAWHPEGNPNMIHFLPPEITPEYIEQSRRLMASWWGCPLEAVELVEAESTLPFFKLAAGWKRTQVVSHPRENFTIIGYKVERVEGE